jgi:hypothetical protein
MPRLQSRRTILGSGGVCMALAMAFIVRNARDVPTVKTAARAKLGGMSDRQMMRIDALMSALDAGDSFTKVSGNEFGALPAHLLDSSSPTYTDDIKKFRNEGDSVPQEIQERHLNIAGLQNATSSHVDRLVGRHGKADDVAKIVGIQHQIWNLTGMRYTEVAPAGDSLGESFWYISDGGHGWAALARTAETNFKLYDPNYGIIGFGTAKDLSDAALQYAGEGAKYLRFT